MNCVNKMDCNKKPLNDSPEFLVNIHFKGDSPTHVFSKASSEELAIKIALTLHQMCNTAHCIVVESQNKALLTLVSYAD